MRELERRVVLSVLDRKWREHLYEMDYLQEGIGLRAMAQKDPLVEYQREGFDMFTRHDGRHQGGVRRLPVQPGGPGRAAGRGGPGARTPARRRAGEALAGKRDAVPAGARPEIRAKGLDAPQRPDRLHFSAPTVDGEGGVVEGDFDERRTAPSRSEADGLTRAERRKAAEGRQRRRKK